MKRILVIEDEKAVRESIVECLRFEGHEVLEAVDGKSGLDQALREETDLILCDIKMPLMDGFQVLEKLKVHKTPPPFIFLTALSSRNDFRTGMNLGADDYLTKPFTLQELTECVHARLLKHQSSEMERKLEVLNKRMDDQSKMLERIAQNSPSAKAEEVSAGKNDGLTSFLLQFNSMYPGFSENILQQYPGLTSTDRTILAGLAFSLSTLQLATLLNIQTESIRKSKFRIRKKMNLSASEDLEQYARRFLKDL